MLSVFWCGGNRSSLPPEIVFPSDHITAVTVWMWCLIVLRFWLLRMVLLGIFCQTLWFKQDFFFSEIEELSLSQLMFLKALSEHSHTLPMYWQSAYFLLRWQSGHARGHPAHCSETTQPTAVKHVYVSVSVGVLHESEGYPFRLIAWHWSYRQSCVAWPGTGDQTWPLKEQ